MRASRTLVYLAALALFAACGSEDGGVAGAPDDASVSADGGSSDATSAQDSSASADASSDAGADAKADAGADATLDASADAPGDAAVDAGGDAPVDAPSDAPPDVIAIDAGPIDCADAGAPIFATGSGFSAVGVFSADTKFILPGSLAGDGHRRFWVQDPVGNGSSGDKMIDVSSSGVGTDRVLPSPAATCTVSQVAMDSSGNGYVFDTVLDSIYRTTPAGVTTVFSNVGGIGGGGNCTDTGVIGMLVRANGTFFLGSPLNNKIYTLSADGVTRADFANVNAPVRLAHDGQDGLFVASGKMIMAVSSVGVVTTRLDATGVGADILALRRDANGDVYFSSGRSLYRSANGTSTFQEVAACFPGNLTDIVFDQPTSDAGAGTSLYVLTTGTDGAQHDPGDQLLEMKR